MARDSQAALVALNSLSRRAGCWRRFRTIPAAIVLAENVFPDSSAVKPMKGLVG